MRTDLRKHPTCQIKGCDQLQAAAVMVGETAGAPEDDSDELYKTGPIEVKVCLKHAREITEGGNQNISMGTK